MNKMNVIFIKANALNVYTWCSPEARILSVYTKHHVMYSVHKLRTFKTTCTHD